MIELAGGPATVIAGTVVVIAAGWASYVSVRSAAIGPLWTLQHLAVARWVALAMTVTGLAALLVVRPLWLGLVLLYVPLAVLVLTWLMKRTLVRLGRLGGLEPMSPQVTAEVLARARGAMVVSGGALIGVGGVGLLTDLGAVSWIVVAVGITVAINGLVIGRSHMSRAPNPSG